MKRSTRKKKQDNRTPEEFRQQFFAEYMDKIHPNIKKNMEKDGVLEAACYTLADSELFDIGKYFGPPIGNVTRIYDYRSGLLGSTAGYSSSIHCLKRSMIGTMGR